MYKPLNKLASSGGSHGGKNRLRGDHESEQGLLDEESGFGDEQSRTVVFGTSRRAVLVTGVLIAACAISGVAMASKKQTTKELRERDSYFEQNGKDALKQKMLGEIKAAAFPTLLPTMNSLPSVQPTEGNPYLPGRPTISPTKARTAGEEAKEASEADGDDFYQDKDEQVKKMTGYTCDELAEKGHCEDVFCPSCIFAHTCDTACGFNPTSSPTLSPTARNPTAVPTPGTWAPTSVPASQPTPIPSASPSLTPTLNPTPDTWPPTAVPASQPSPIPSSSPSLRPTLSPTPKTWSPTAVPASQPTPIPSSSPSLRPTLSPTPKTWSPTAVPASQPTPIPSSSPSLSPTVSPTPGTWVPTPVPSMAAGQPSPLPSSVPTVTWPPTTSPTPFCGDKEDEIVSVTAHTCKHFALQGMCPSNFCPTCAFAHMCDRTCGFCPTYNGNPPRYGLIEDDELTDDVLKTKDLVQSPEDWLADIQAIEAAVEDKQEELEEEMEEFEEQRKEEKEAEELAEAEEKKEIFLEKQDQLEEAMAEAN